MAIDNTETGPIDPITEEIKHVEVHVGQRRGGVVQQGRRRAQRPWRVPLVPPIALAAVVVASGADRPSLYGDFNAPQIDDGPGVPVDVTPEEPEGIPPSLLEQIPKKVVTNEPPKATGADIVASALGKLS